MIIPEKPPCFLMCSPDYFELTAPDPEHGFANDMIAAAYDDFINNPAYFKAKALTQWEILKETLIGKLSADIELLEPVPELHDQCFTADASLSFNRTTLISKMTHPGRGAESDIHFAKIKTLYPDRDFHINTLPSEGTGDNLYDPYRNLFWSGYTSKLSSHCPAEGRSDLNSHAYLAEKTGVNVISLEVKRPFFHIDTSLAALPQGHILYYPGGMSDEALTALKYEGLEKFNLDAHEYLIEVEEAEAMAYACNLVYANNKLVLPECGDRIPNLLRNKGYEVTAVDLSCFIQAGGGPHCLTNNLSIGNTR